MARRARFLPLAPLIALLLALGSAVAEDEEPAPSRPGSERSEPPEARTGPDVTRAHVRAIRKGLDRLARVQNPDGSWNDRKASLAVTSLAVLALMGNGHTENRGEHSEAVRDGVKFLLRHVTMPDSATPQIPAGYVHVKGDEYSKMHAHGYATLALALAYGMSDRRRREEMRTKLELAVRLIQDSQDASGGWWYHPTPDRHEGSVTVCQIQALRMAREAGIPVRKDRIDLAVSYLKRSQDTRTGGFCYSLDERGKQTPALTAAALSTLFSLGRYDERGMIELGLEYMRREGLDLYRQDWFFYGNFYAAQAMYQAAATTWGAKYWREWWPRIRDYLVESQNDEPGDPEDGRWDHPRHGRDEYGEHYATAFACLILEVPLEVLPIFQR